MPDVTPASDVSLAADSTLKLILMGTGPFAIPSFEALYTAGHDCMKVVTRPPRGGQGRRAAGSSPVGQWAEQRDLPVLAPESINAPTAVDLLGSLRPDLLVVCDYGQILSAEALTMAHLGGINLHGSLLPAYRGAAPVQWAVLNGETETGVSVIHMTAQLDAGPVIAVRRTEIRPKETAGQLEQRLAELGVDATLEAVAQLVRAVSAGQPPRAEPQDPKKASRAPRLSKSDGRILWSRAAAQLERHVYGMQPWPGAFTEVPPGAGRATDPLRLVVLDMDITDDAVSESSDAGTVSITDGSLRVASGDRWVRINRIKPAGKREMSSEEWLRGRPISAGTVLV